MHNFSAAHLVIIFLSVAILLVPAWRIANKAGFHGAWTLLLLVPPINLIMIWIFAFMPWPVEQRRQ